MHTHMHTQAGGPSAGPADPLAPADVGRMVERLLRRLLRVTSAEQAVDELLRLVHALGARTVPARDAGPDALAIDLSFGVLPEPLLPVAQPGSSVRATLEARLPLLVEDVRTVVTRLDQATRAEHEAVVDPLTGLLNRRGLGRTARHAAGEYTVAMLDLDHFKHLNDTRGHEAGDRVLSAFADSLRGSIRADDVCARVGGEEFVLLLPATSVSAAVSLVQRCADRWRREQPYRITFSAGIAAGDQRGFKVAIASADEALYRAKETGRDRIVVADMTAGDAGR